MSDDAIVVAPHNYKTIFENERVRLLEYKGKSGDKTAMHAHPDLVAYAMSPAKIKFTLPDGQEMDAELKTGDTMFGAGHEPCYGEYWDERRSRPSLRAEIAQGASQAQLLR